MTTLKQRLLGLLVTAGLLAFAVGFPALLTLIGLSPAGIIAHPTWTALLDAADWKIVWVGLGIIGWGVWLVLVYCLLVELVAALRNVHAPELRCLSLPQHTARALIAWASLLFVTATVTVAPAAGAVVGSQIPAIAATAPARSDAAAPDVAPTPALTSSSRLAAVPASAPTPRDTPAGSVPYTVVRGDTLWKIADTMLGDPLRYPEIAALNADILGGKPDFITPGLILALPGDARAAAAVDDADTVVVTRGDTLSQIAKDELGDATRYPEIFEASKDTVQPDGAHLTDPDLIRPGWELTLPSDTATGDEPAVAELAVAPASPEPKPSAAPRATATPSATPTTEPSASTPSASPATESPAQVHQAPSAAETPDQEQTNGWLLPALAGAGAVLSGALLLVLRANRRSQLRFRTPGMLIAPEPVEVVAIDRTSRVVGGPVAPRIQALDKLLRSLASAFVDPSCYPPLLAVELDAETATLHLAEDATLGEPWTGAGTRWSAPLSSNTQDVDVVAPYPMLASIGADNTGVAWLLNLERFRTLNVAGDAEQTQRFGRHLATELALSPWSTLVQVHLLGFGDELADLDEFRLIPYPASDAGALEAATRSVTGSDCYDPEELHVLVIAACAAPSENTTQLAHAITSHEKRPGAAIVTLTEPASDAATVLELDGARLRVPALGIDLRAPGLSQDEASSVAEIIRVTQTRAYVPVPVDGTITAGYAALINATGALREPLVDARPSPDEEAGPTSLLPEPAAAYVDAAATTEQDVATLAPPVPPSTTDKALAADPTLDDDLALWRKGDQCPIPRVMLLGKLRATAHGVSQEVSERKHHYIELMTYLWAHPHGATSATLADEFHLTRERARVEVSHLRKYLGIDPHTGAEHLPSAPGTRARNEEGWTGYTLHGVLFDVDLFRRLRARAQARGADGLPDLIAALRLVRGEPFADIRPDSWTWMFEGERFDQEFAAAIIDVAHLVATRCMKEGDLPTARRASEIGLSASPYDEISRLDLAKTAELEGNDAEAAQIRGEGIFQRTDDYRPPLDPSERSVQIATRHRIPRT